MQKVTDNIYLLVLFAMVGTFILAASFIFFFLKYQRKALLQKEAMQKAELAYGEGLLHATLQSQEEERKRIGRDLHDDVGASLSNLKMIMAQSDTDGKHKPLIDNIITTVRTISHTLSPPGLDLFGLEYSLHELFDTVNAAGVLQVHFQNNLAVKIDALNKKTALALYRVMQELLNNTIKHAEAKNITVNFFEENNKTIVTYADDGKGISNTAKKLGMGMQNIEARLKMIPASFEITSIEGNGFFIKMIV